MKVIDKYLRVTMPDGTKWDVPVRVIAENRANHYKDEYGNSLSRSLDEDTIPLFESDEYEIQDWAANNMNWADVKSVAVQAPSLRKKVDYEDGWCNGEKEIVERENA